MNTKNFNLLYKTFRKENFLEIIAQCVNLENCALLLEAFEILYESSSIIQPSIIQIIDQKLIFLRDQGTINDKLYVNFYDNYMKTKEMRHPSYILILETYQRKIAKTFHYIVHPFYDSLKTKNLLFEAILVWMLMLTHHQDQREYKYVVDIAKLIKSMFVKKAWFNSDIDFECFNRVMMVGFSAINQEFRDGELIRPDLNFCVILEMVC